MVTINTGQSFNSTIGTLTYFPVLFSGNVSNWSAAGLPNGLKIDPASGYIFGIPQEGSTPFIEEVSPENFPDKDTWTAQISATESGTGQVYTQNININVGYSFPAIVNGFLMEGQVGVPFSSSVIFPDTVSNTSQYNNIYINTNERPPTAIFFGSQTMPSGLYVNNLFYNKPLSEFKDLPQGLKHVGGGLIEGIPSVAGRFTVSVTTLQQRIGSLDLNRRFTSSIEILIHESSSIIYPENVLPSKKISGSSGSCLVVLNKDRTCTFYGDNTYGQHDINQQANGLIKDVQVGYTAAFALKSDGSLTSWGRSCEAQYVPTGNDFIKIAYAAYQGLALKSNGTVVPIGSNHGSCLGNDPFVPHSSILSATDVQNIFIAPAALASYYALLSDGKLVGTSARADQFISYDNTTEVDNLGCPTGNYTFVSISEQHALALRTDGTVLSFGYLGYKDSLKTPIELNSVSKIFAGIVGFANDEKYLSIAIKTNGEIVSWGSGSHLFNLILSEYGLTSSSGLLIDDIVINSDCFAILLKNGTVFNYDLGNAPSFHSVGIVNPNNSIRVEDEQILDVPINSTVFEKLKVSNGDVYDFFGTFPPNFPSGLNYDSRRGIIYGSTSEIINQYYNIEAQRDPTYVALNIKPSSTEYQWPHRFKITTKRKKTILSKNDNFTLIVPTYFYSKITGTNRFRIFNGSSGDRILWSVDGASFVGMASGTFILTGNYVDKYLTKGWHRIIFVYQNNLNGSDNPSGCVKIRHDKDNRFYAPVDIMSCLNKNAKTCIPAITSIESFDERGFPLITEKLSGLVYVASTGEENTGKWNNYGDILNLSNFTIDNPNATINFPGTVSGGISFVNSIEDLYSPQVLGNIPFGTEWNGESTGTDIYSWPLLVHDQIVLTPTPTATPTPTPTPTTTATHDNSINVFLKTDKIGDSVSGDLTITANFGIVAPNSITKSQLLSGVTVLVDNSASQLTIYSSGPCNDSKIVQILTCSTHTTTFAGSGSDGGDDGNGILASFYSPSCVSTSGSGEVYVIDRDAIRVISPLGEVKTVIANNNPYLSSPQALVVVNSNIYVCDGNAIIALYPISKRIGESRPNSYTVVKLAGSTSAGYVDGPGTSARFHTPCGICFSGTHLFVSERGNHTIRKVSLSGTVTTLAGGGENININGPSSGYADGIGTLATFNTPSALTAGPNGNIYVADSNNNIIRKITPSGVVTTLAGNSSTGGYQDGNGNNAKFNSPIGITSSNRKLYVVDGLNKCVRTVTLDGDVTLAAGPRNGNSGYRDGNGETALFNSPKGITSGANDILYVADLGNRRIRKITLI